MIKRRFYRADHGDRDGGSSDSSSSSDSDIEAQSAEDSDTQPQQQPQPEPDTDVEADQSDDDHDHDDDDDDDDDKRPSLKPQSPSSSSSGYESEDSSANEIDAESVGLLANDDDSETGRDREWLDDNIFSRKENGTVEEALATDHPVADDVPSCVLKCKSVFKCRLCPKIVCLNEESLNTHLNSKRHARSEKLLNNGRLKRILNSDGEEEVVSDDDGETHAERHARIVALAQNTDNKKSRGRQRQRQRLKRKNQNLSSNIQNNGQQKDNRAKRRRKNVD